MITRQLPGTDITASITVNDSEGNPIDLTNLSGYYLIAFIKPNRIIARFAFPPTSGYLDVESAHDINPTAGQIKIHIPAEKTKDINNQVIHLVFYAKTNDDPSITFGTAEGIAYELVHITNSPHLPAP
jgi:hypothetical protein